jgi:hypothetical protein
VFDLAIDLLRRGLGRLEAGGITAGNLLTARRRM